MGTESSSSGQANVETVAPRSVRELFLAFSWLALQGFGGVLAVAQRELVEKMIVDMGLQSCANTFCGDDMIRGISGGEKKRTAIGIELVMKPQVCDGSPWTRSECASNAD